MTVTPNQKQKTKVQYYLQGLITVFRPVESKLLLSKFMALPYINITFGSLFKTLI